MANSKLPNPNLSATACKLIVQHVSTGASSIEFDVNFYTYRMSVLILGAQQNGSPFAMLVGFDSLHNPTIGWKAGTGDTEPTAKIENGKLVISNCNANWGKAILLGIA